MGVSRYTSQMHSNRPASHSQRFESFMVMLDGFLAERLSRLGIESREADHQRKRSTVPPWGVCWRLGGFSAFRPFAHRLPRIQWQLVLATSCNRASDSCARSCSGLALTR